MTYLLDDVCLSSTWLLHLFFCNQNYSGQHLLSTDNNSLRPRLQTDSAEDDFVCIFRGRNEFCRVGSLSSILASADALESGVDVTTLHGNSVRSQVLSFVSILDSQSTCLDL